MRKTGKRYRTKHSAYQFIVQGPDPIRHPVSGDVIGFKKEIIAEAAIHRGEQIVKGPSGEDIKVADIAGHYINLDEQAVEKQWTDDEIERVEMALDLECSRQPGLIQLIADPVFTAPWPMYDDTHHKQIPTLAQSIGMVAEALAYELQNKQRPEVCEKLEAILTESRLEAEAEAALSVA